MANTMGYHRLEQSILRKPQPGREAKMPPQANIIAAASRIRQLLESKKLVYSIMGGLQMFCLGNERDISDLHIAYEDKDFSRIRKKLEVDRRVQLPEGMNPLVASKILVETGPLYQDLGCTRSATVEVYLLPPGSCGTPPSGMLNDNTVLLSYKVGGVLKTFKGLNMLYLVKTLVQFCKARELTWNPQQDILFLCQRYGGQIQAVRNQLDQKAIHQNFLYTPFFAALPSEDQRRCYQILAGQTPLLPAVTSPPVPHNSHFHSQTNSSVPKARVVSHNSSFAPTTLSSHGSQGPQQFQKDRPFLKHAANVSLPHINLSSDPQSPPEAIVSAKDSRSRYRPMSNPNSRRTSPMIPQVNGLLPNPKASAASSNIQPVPVHQLDSDTTLHTTSHSTLTMSSNAPIETRPRPHVDTVRAQASYHPRESDKSEGNVVPQRRQRRHHVSMFEMSATPTQPNPRQGHGPSQIVPASKPVVNTNPTANATPQTGTSSVSNTSKLHIVGPEGVHQAPPSTKHSAQQQQQQQQQPPPVFELAAPSPQEKDIMAALSADIDAAIQTSKDSRLASASTPAPAPAPAPAPVQDSAVRRRPLHPRAVSAPLAMLPTSLIPGYNGGGSKPVTPPAYGGGGGGGGGGGMRYYTPPSDEKEQQTGQGHVCAMPPQYGEVPASPPLTPAPLAVYKAYQPHSQSQSRSMPASPLPAAACLASVSCSPPSSAERLNRRGDHGDDAVYDAGDILQQVHAEIERSLDSRMLAMEYRAELPEFEDGYGGGWGVVR